MLIQEENAFQEGKNDQLCHVPLKTSQVALKIYISLGNMGVACGHDTC